MWLHVTISFFHLQGVRKQQKSASVLTFCTTELSLAWVGSFSFFFHFSFKKMETKAGIGNDY